MKGTDRTLYPTPPVKSTGPLQELDIISYPAKEVKLFYPTDNLEGGGPNVDLVEKTG